MYVCTDISLAKLVASFFLLRIVSCRVAPGRVGSCRVVSRIFTQVAFEMWHFIVMFSTWAPLIKWLSNCHNRFVKRLLLVPRLAAQQPAGPSASLPSYCQLARWEFTTPPLFYRYGFLIWDRRYQALSYLKGKTKERCQNLYILRQHAILNRAKLGVKTSSAEGRLGPQCDTSP